MRGTELLYKMELIDPAFIEAAEEAPQRGRSKWRMWGPIAACFFLLVGIFAAAWSGAFLRPQGETAGASAPPAEGVFDVAYSLRLEGNKTIVYDPIDFEDCLRYGLVPQNAAGLDRPLKITEADIGEFMGTVTGCHDPALNGCKAYHYARYPEKDAICIIDTPQGYAFYSCRELRFAAVVGALSDDLFSLYGLPDSLEKMEVLTPVTVSFLKYRTRRRSWLSLIPFPAKQISGSPPPIAAMPRPGMTPMGMRMFSSMKSRDAMNSPMLKRLRKRMRFGEEAAVISESRRKKASSC